VIASSFAALEHSGIDTRQTAPNPYHSNVDEAVHHSEIELKLARDEAAISDG